MARLPDRPGTFRVKPKGAGFRLTGLRSNGERVNLSAGTRMEADRLASTLFGSPETPSIGPIHSPTSTPIDDWGIPIRVTPEVAASVNASLGIKPTPTGPAVTTPKPDDDEKARVEKERRAKHAKSLMEMAGVGYAAGTVMLSKRMVDNGGKTPVNPSPRQVNDLADCSKETFIEWFGDRDIKPWQMMLLLTFGIPMSMWLQSPKKKAEQLQNETKLKSVP